MRIFSLHVRARLAIVLVALSGFACTLPTTITTPTLRSLGTQHSIRIGVAVNMDALAADYNYRALVSREFSMITPENIMKFDSIHPQRNQYDFVQADALVAFAEEQRMAVHGHVLVWHQQLPEWLTGGNFDRAELKSILRDHIHTVVGRYRGRIAVWDVVSEVIGEDGKLLDTFWSRGIGPDYLELVFKWAREADPDARLVYNDYGAEAPGVKSDGVLKLVTALRMKGVPIDGVGLQMHVTLDDAPAPKDVTENIKRLARQGLEVHISEMDVAIEKPVTSSKLASQARIYADMLRTCLAEVSCKSFTVWGASDQYSWIPEHYSGFDAALLFDKEFKPKPAYRALQDVLKTRP